jgi:hypothetical protein
MGLVVADDGWPWTRCGRRWSRSCRSPGASLGCHNPRVPDREAMNAVPLVLRTGMQWNAPSVRPAVSDKARSAGQRGSRRHEAHDPGDRPGHKRARVDAPRGSCPSAR